MRWINTAEVNRIKPHLYTKRPLRYAKSRQRDRVLSTRRYLNLAQSLAGKGRLKVIEYGCHCLDIAGILSDTHEVIGYEIDPLCIEVAKEVYPAANIIQADITQAPIQDCDIAVLSEILEHLRDPRKLVSEVLTHSRFVIVSHPIGEPINSRLTDGQHCWSFSLNDFHDWFHQNNHHLFKWEIIRNHRLFLGLGLGVRQ
jgi:2-polyprenyl-3-methyl-5-hydroxy-6-metoxy-1,4-benzoquinol methylase